jgi:hypothetical protein
MFRRGIYLSSLAIVLQLYKRRAVVLLLQELPGRAVQRLLHLERNSCLRAEQAERDQTPRTLAAAAAVRPDAAAGQAGQVKVPMMQTPDLAEQAEQVEAAVRGAMVEPIPATVLTA